MASTAERRESELASTSRSKVAKGAEALKAFLYLGRMDRCLERAGLYLVSLILYNSKAPGILCSAFGPPP